jgi:hypothetical protein
VARRAAGWIANAAASGDGEGAAAVARLCRVLATGRAPVSLCSGCAGV